MLLYFTKYQSRQSAANLNETVLENTLSQLPGLLSLHVIGCPRVDHSAIFRCVRHTPLLESLSFTTFIHVCVWQYDPFISADSCYIHRRPLAPRHPHTHVFRISSIYPSTPVSPSSL